MPWTGLLELPASGGCGKAPNSLKEESTLYMCLAGGYLHRFATSKARFLPRNHSQGERRFILSGRGQGEGLSPVPPRPSFLAWGNPDVLHVDGTLCKAIERKRAPRTAGIIGAIRVVESICDRNEFGSRSGNNASWSFPCDIKSLASGWIDGGLSGF